MIPGRFCEDLLQLSNSTNDFSQSLWYVNLHTSNSYIKEAFSTTQQDRKYLVYFIFQSLGEILVKALEEFKLKGLISKAGISNLILRCWVQDSCQQNEQKKSASTYFLHI